MQALDISNHRDPSNAHSQMACSDEYCSITDEIFARVSGRLFGGRLLLNSARGDWVEEMVSLALEPDWRLCSGDWNSWDLENDEGLRLQVKQSAARQSWGTASSGCRFSIAPVTGFWKDGTEWTPYEGRVADIYLFAWHPVTDDAVDHRDPRQWLFHVIREQALPAGQKTIGLAAIDRLGPAVSFMALREAVNAAASRVRPHERKARMQG